MNKIEMPYIHIPKVTEYKGRKIKGDKRLLPYSKDKVSSHQEVNKEIYSRNWDRIFAR